MKPCPSCGGDCGYTKKKGCQYKSNEFTPDWDGTADMVEEIQRLAKRVEELETKKWVGLTPNELNEIFDSFKSWNSFQITDVYFAIEAKLKEKNHVDDRR